MRRRGTPADVVPTVILLRSDTGAGSGVIFDERGLAITCHHVVGDATELIAECANRETYRAAVVTTWFSADLAVVSLSRSSASGRAKEPFPAIDLSTASRPEPFSEVFVIGCALGESHSMTRGIVSRIVRTDSGIERIQTDAAIHPGHSGGALVNANGKLVGICSSGRMAGMNYAIAIEPWLVRMGSLRGAYNHLKSAIYCSVCGEFSAVSNVYCSKCGSSETGFDLLGLRCQVCLRIRESLDEYCRGCGVAFVPESRDEDDVE